MKKTKELAYTSIGRYERGEWAVQWKIKKFQERSQNPKKSRKKLKALVTKEMTLSNLGKNIFIGDLAATSHMTNNKIGVYNLTPKRVCNDWKWEEHHLHSQKNT